MNELNATAHKILDIAVHLTQTRGFNAFSYKDIQKKLGIKTSSIHYYFPTKQDLAHQMLKRYLEMYEDTLRQIKQKSTSTLKKLKALGDIFLSAEKEDKFCLCGMLTADFSTLDTPVKTDLDRFFRISEQWITEVLQEGVTNKEINQEIDPNKVAVQILATLEGGLLISRTRKDSDFLRTAINQAMKLDSI